MTSTRCTSTGCAGRGNLGAIGSGAAHESSYLTGSGFLNVLIGGGGRYWAAVAGAAAAAHGLPP